MLAVPARGGGGTVAGRAQGIRFWIFFGFENVSGGRGLFMSRTITARTEENFAERVLTVRHRCYTIVIPL